MTVLGDAAYGTGELRARLQGAGHAAVIKPPPLHPGRPRRLHRRRLHHRRAGRHRDLPGRARRDAGPPARRRHPPGPVQGPLRRLPAAPALHHLQNRAGPQSVHPQHALLAAARRAAADPAWKDEYRRWRPPVERAIAWLVARGSRRVPYRGIASNNAWLANRAAALNLRRLANLGLTRTTDGTWALA